MPPKKLASVGARFGKLIVSAAPVSRNGLRYPCHCDCGNPDVVWVTITSLNQRAARGGGCARCASPTTHGHGSSRNPTYSSYQAMKQRCCNPKHVSYAQYGGRGIKVCDRWADSFQAFLDDMGEKPIGATIERLDTNGNYESANCVWLARSEQNKNTTRCRRVELDGLTFATLKEAAEHFGIKYQTVKTRVLHYGMSLEEALKRPVKNCGCKSWVREIA